MRSEPAEVYPGESVRLDLTIADRTGPITTASVDWAFCSAPKPPTENNVISDRCLRDEVRSIGGNGLAVMARVPVDACALFGPELPPSAAGDMVPRPRDPDRSGGFYQPVRARVLGLTAIGLVRIRCGLSGASQETAAAFRARYLPNRNPSGGPLSATEEETPISLAAVPAGHSIRFALAVSEDSRESFLWFDPTDQELKLVPEQLRVSWLAGQGSFLRSATTHDAADSHTIHNEWIAPEQAGPVMLWTVLRDSRGGVTVYSHSVQVMAAGPS